MNKKTVIFINFVGVLLIVSIFLYLSRGEFDIESNETEQANTTDISKNIAKINRETNKTISLIKGKIHKEKNKIDSPESEDEFDMYGEGQKRVHRGYISDIPLYKIPHDTSSNKSHKQDSESEAKQSISSEQTPQKRATTDTDSDTNKTEDKNSDVNKSSKQNRDNQYHDNPYEWAVEWPFNNDKNLSQENNSSSIVDGESIEDLIESIGGDLGNLVLIRIFKEEKRLELWMSITGEYKLLKSYKLINYTGTLGPKLFADDNQSPEGYYHILSNGLIEDTEGHIQAQLVFPNKFDQEHNVSDGYVTIHDNDTDKDGFTLSQPDMDEISEVIKSTFVNGYKSVSVYIYPFVMSDDNLNNFKDSPWFGFWQNIKGGYDYFQNFHRTPVVDVINKKYVFHIL